MVTRDEPRRVLVTGGAGYIGSHACLALLESGCSVVSVDNLFRGHAGAHDALGLFGGDRFNGHEISIHETEALTDILVRDRIDAVMHFAAFAEVGESMDHPLRYVHNNVAGTMSVLQAMDRADVRALVFSSSCATYGAPPGGLLPIREDCPQTPINPYGASKLYGERMILEYAEARRRAGRHFACAMLRYFNVAGADPGGRLGEDHDPESHLIPICLQVALGQRSAIGVFGADWPTHDGTCIRDYVHVSDLVQAHLCVLDALRPWDVRRYNVGIGRGFSVRECIESVRRVTGVPIAATDAPRRDGDPPILVADASLIRRELGWQPAFTDLDAIVDSAWQWFKLHPKGWAG
jgi:UDP-glucose 4-epimerase